MYVRERIVKEITKKLEDALKAAIDQGDFSLDDGFEPQVGLETPREKERGDFACTVAMQLPKHAHKAPRQIAEAIVSRLDLEGIPVESVEIAGPGFINFKLTPTWRNEAVTEVLELSENYGRTYANQGKTYNMEFVSANPTGPMHVGNARGGAIGDVLASAAEWTGYDVTREFYVNDAGNQIIKLEDTIEARFWQEMGEDYPVPEDGYQGEDIAELVHEYVAGLNKEDLEVLKQLEPAERKHFISNYVIMCNLNKMYNDLMDYGIEYDVWFSEQSLYEKDLINRAVEKLWQSGSVYVQDGAVWFKSTDYGLDKDDVLIRANGVPTYFMGDIAYHLDKLQTRKFDKAVNVWGADHYGHIARLKAAVKAAGGGENLEIVLMQLVKLLRGDEVVRMSKRTGKMITLSELVQDIGVDAARFFFNLRSPESHLEFDLDLAVKESNENPVFYVQYAHARIASILRKLGEEVDLKKLAKADMELLKEPEELLLIDEISKFPETIVRAEETMDPSWLTRYAMSLASAFHSFYNAHRVNIDEKELKEARVALIMATKQVLENVSKILGISAPDRM